MYRRRHPKERKAIREALRQWLDANEVTVKQFAEMIQISPHTVNTWLSETTAGFPHRWKRDDILRITGIDISNPEIVIEL